MDRRSQRTCLLCLRQQLPHRSEGRDYRRRRGDASDPAGRGRPGTPKHEGQGKPPCLCPERLAADSAYGSAEMLGWLVNERAIEPHIPVFDKSARDDGTFSREDFAYDQEADIYVCPAGKELSSTGTLVNDGT